MSVDKILTNRDIIGLNKNEIVNEPGQHLHRWISKAFLNQSYSAKGLSVQTPRFQAANPYFVNKDYLEEPNSYPNVQGLQHMVLAMKPFEMEVVT